MRTVQLPVGMVLLQSMVVASSITGQIRGGIGRRDVYRRPMPRRPTR